MKKYYMIFMLILMSVSVVFGGTTKTLSEKPVLVDWEFAPEVSTDLGFNLDSQMYGLKGVIKLSLKSTIYSKADYELTGEGTAYGHIKVKDLEIKVDVDEATEGSAVGATGSDRPLVVSWGDIEGTIFFNPMISLQLSTTGHSEVDLAKTLDNGDLELSNIGYDVISPRHSASFAELAPITRSITNADGTPGTETVTVFGSDPAADAFAENDLAGVTLKVAIPYIMNMEFGFSTRYTFLQNSPVTHEGMNPISFSFLLDLKAVENLTFKFKNSLIAGIDGGGMNDKGNPTKLGVLVGYGLPVGDNTLTPRIAFDMSIEKSLRYDGLIVERGLAPLSYNEADDVEQAITYEVGLGVVYDWKTKGYDAKESDHLGMNAASDNDIKVTDGVSLGVVYGSVPIAGFAVETLPYVGAKIALWDTEDGDKQGLLKGFKLGLIANINYMLGYEKSFSDATDNAEGSAGLGDIKIPANMDMGLGLEASYTIQFVKPFLGLLYKKFNLLDVANPISLGPAVGAAEATRDSYYNPTDFRIKLGLDITKLVSNTTFTIQWQSGNLANEDEINGGETTYKDGNYFKNVAGSATTADYLVAKSGYISVGAKISF